MLKVRRDERPVTAALWLAAAAAGQDQDEGQHAAHDGQPDGTAMKVGLAGGLNE